jgi:hypothetical protein
LHNVVAVCAGQIACTQDPSHYVNGSFIIWHLVDVVAKGGLMQVRTEQPRPCLPALPSPPLAGFFRNGVYCKVAQLIDELFKSCLF